MYIYVYIYKDIGTENILYVYAYLVIIPNF